MNKHNNLTSIKSKKKVLLVSTLLSLFFGTMVYFLFNEKVLFFEIIGISSVNLNNSFIESYLSDFFYVLALTFLCHLFFVMKIPKIHIYSILISPITFEIIQFFRPELGTFDYFDLILFVSWFIIYYSFIFSPYEA